MAEVNSFVQTIIWEMAVLKLERPDILRHLLDRGVEDAALGGAEFLLRKIARKDPVSFLILGHGETPDAGEEAVDALHAGGAPWLSVLERSHEHLVEPQGIGAVFGDDGVGIHHVAAALGHLHPVLSEDEALIDEALEGFGGGEVAEIEENLVPEARIEQVEHGVLGAADVEVDPASFAARAHPVLLGFPADEAVVVPGIAEAEVVPAGSRPLRHGVQLTRRGLRVTHPLLGLRERVVRPFRSA